VTNAASSLVFCGLWNRSSRGKSLLLYILNKGSTERDKPSCSESTLAPREQNQMQYSLANISICFPTTEFWDTLTTTNGPEKRLESTVLRGTKTLQ
jgi:hypothetical protein